MSWLWSQWTSLADVARLALCLHLSLVAGVEDRLALPVAHLGAALLEESVLDGGVDGVVRRPALWSPSVAAVSVVPSDLMSDVYQEFINKPDNVQNLQLEDGENLKHPTMERSWSGIGILHRRESPGPCLLVSPGSAHGSPLETLSLLPALAASLSRPSILHLLNLSSEYHYQSRRAEVFNINNISKFSSLRKERLKLVDL